MINARKGVSAVAFTLKNISLIYLATMITAQKAAGDAIKEGIRDGIRGGIKGGIKTGIALQEKAMALYAEAREEYEEEKREV